jgi:signal transduction histidine kinase
VAAGRWIVGSYFRPIPGGGPPTYADKVHDTTATERLDGHTASLLVVTVVALTVVDVVLARALLGSTAVVLLADVGVISAVLIARHNLLAATLLAAVVSATMSAAVSQPTFSEWGLDAGLIDVNRFVGAGALPGIGELAGLAVLCALAIRHMAQAQAGLATAAYGGAVLAIVGWRQHGEYQGLFLLTLGVAFAATVATGLSLRTTEERRAEAARATRQSERDAIARELHDLVAHHVTGIVVQAQAARLVAAGRPDVTASALSSIEQAGTEALSSMRAMVGALRADRGEAPMAPTATLDDIRRLATSSPGAMSVVVMIDAAAEQVASSVTASLHRIAIEAVTNARRHARDATNVQLAVTCGPGQVVLSVSNDGAVVEERQRGFGLMGIAERVAALGGRFEAGPRPAGGWLVTVVLPIEPTEQRA